MSFVLLLLVKCVLLIIVFQIVFRTLFFACNQIVSQFNKIHLQIAQYLFNFFLHSIGEMRMKNMKSMTQFDFFSSQKKKRYDNRANRISKDRVSTGNRQTSYGFYRILSAYQLNQHKGFVAHLIWTDIDLLWLSLIKNVDSKFMTTLEISTGHIFFRKKWKWMEAKMKAKVFYNSN